MRTTLAIDDDVLAVAKELAVAQGTTVGKVISQLVRRALCSAESLGATRNGVSLLPLHEDSPRVTPELVQHLREELP